MDDPVMLRRRAARGRHARRRRRLLAAVALLAPVALVIALTTSGDDASRRHRHPPTRAHHATATAPASSQVTHFNPPMAGAHPAVHEAVPILMYHVIGNLRAGTPNPTLWVSRAELSDQVRTLRRAGYHGVTLQQVWSAWHHQGLLPSRPLVLSFDDGYRGQVRDALPTLRRAGWAGVLNLELGNVRDMGGTRAISRMIRAGWEIDSHTITHPDLTTVGAARLRHEVAGSRARLKRYFHVPVSFFCYPSGRYDVTVAAAVRAAGYRAATTTRPGWARPGGEPFALPRVRVDGGMSARALLQRVRDARSGSGA